MDQKKIVHKGIYISNERRKGFGGRIKSTEFTNKIQVRYKNAALHQSQVQWVQVRRYIKGDNQKDKPKQKRQKQKKQTKKSQTAKNKYVQKNIYQKQQTKTEKEDKKLQSKLQSQQTDGKTLQKQNMQEQIKRVQESKIQQRQVDQNTNVQNLKEIQDRADQRQQNQQSQGQTNQISKQFNQESQQTKQESKKQVEKQQIIVAQIVKETNIIYKQKRFVGILTCTKKKNSKGSTFIQKNIGPIEHIIKDYYLDLEPIHSRLPKMQVDNLELANIQILTSYVESFFPQKGKQLTKGKLNKILDLIQSVYVVATFAMFDKGDNAYSNIHQVIGKTYTIDGQCDCFLHEHHLNGFTYQPTEQQKQKEAIKLQLCPTQYHKAFEKMVFSIDPATSVDLDDALSIQKINQKQFQIGIHIADVSQYLKHISRDQLIRRTTSVYLPHRVFHMLPNNIVQICSLNPNVQRLAFTIFVKMNLQGQIVGQSRLEKNVVKSRFKLSYQIVQDIITAKTDYQKFSQRYKCSIQQFQALAEKLGALTLIATKHRQKRITFQVFQNKEISFSLDQNRWPVQLAVETRFTAKKVVQQYMIIGNVQAAKKLIQNFDNNALIIYHPKPTELSIKYFNQNFKFLNIDFKFQDILKVQQQLKAIDDDQNISIQIKQFLFFKARRVQEAANYRLHYQVVSQLKTSLNLKQQDQLQIKKIHFALGEEFYTHFTSPMRRLADILVHQTLSSLVCKTQTKKVESEVIQKINNGRRHTKRLKKDINQMYICLMIFKTHKIIEESGIVISFGLKSISIYLPLFDMMKQLMWKDQLEVHRVKKDTTDPQTLDVCVYYDKRNASKDVYWKVKKFDRVKVFMDCTTKPPLRLWISLQVNTKKGKQKIYAVKPES